MSGPDSAWPDRRRFLAAAGALTGSGWLAVNAPLLLAAGEAAADQLDAGAGWGQLDDREAACLAAVVDQIIPPDDLPGAAEMGAVHFIDQALGGFMAAGAEGLREGMRDLDRRAVALGGADFAGLPFAEQTRVLRAVEDSPFFGQMIFLTHCGIFAMPRWGGNRGGAGWKLIGFDARHAWQPPFGYYDAQAAGEAMPDDEA